MPDNGAARPPASRPYGMFLFHFQVSWGDGTRMSFEEVSGLDVDTHTIDYRGSSRPDELTIKRPSIRKPGNITLKRGVFACDGALPDWLTPGKANVIKRITVTIELVDAKGTPRMRWKLKNAFVAKVAGPSLNAKGNEMAIESIEIAHEGLSLDNG